MELLTPVRAHAEWIALFRETLYGRKALPTHSMGDGRCCEVGQWLDSYRESLGHLPEFQRADETHDLFHSRAAYCLKLANSGYRSDALAETGDGGELRQLSQRLVQAFQDLKHRVRQQHLDAVWDVETADM